MKADVKANLSLPDKNEQVTIQFLKQVNLYSASYLCIPCMTTALAFQAQFDQLVYIVFSEKVVPKKLESLNFW